jgi:hypothetical protein
MVLKNQYQVPGTRSGFSESGSETLVVVKSDNQCFGSALVFRQIQHYRHRQCGFTIYHHNRSLLYNSLLYLLDNQTLALFFWAFFISLCYWYVPGEDPNISNRYCSLQLKNEAKNAFVPLLR